MLQKDLVLLGCGSPTQHTLNTQVRTKPEKNGFGKAVLACCMGNGEVRKEGAEQKRGESGSIIN